MDDKNNNSDSDDNLFDDSLGLFDDFFGQSDSDKPDAKEKNTALDTPPEKTVQKKESSQNSFNESQDLFGDLDIPAKSAKAPVSKAAPTVKDTPAKIPVPKKPPPQKPPIKETTPSAQPRQSKPPVKKGPAVTKGTSPAKKPAKKIPQSVPQKKQEVKTKKESPAKEAAPGPALTESKPVPGPVISAKKSPDMDNKPVEKEIKKVAAEEKPKKRVNPVIFALSIIVLVILSMYIGSIMDFDGLLNLIKRESFLNSVKEPVPVDETRKKEAAAPKEIKTPPPKEELADAITKKIKVEPKVEPEVEKPEIQVPDTVKESEEIKVKAESIPPKKSDKISPVVKKRVLSFPYSVYLGSYSGIANVKKASSDYEKMGITTYWIKLDLGEKGVWYRFFTGYFQTKKEADEYIRTLKIQDAESRITKYSNLMGTYTSKEDIENHKARLEEQGYSPYIINDAEGIYHIYTGAFNQKFRAEELHSDLARDGIESELVER